jgi:hypothetical protein
MEKRLEPPKEVDELRDFPESVQEVLVFYDQSFTGFKGSGVMPFDSEE